MARKFLSKNVAAAALVVLFASVAFADTIRLKDGSIIKGKITDFSGGVFTVVIGEGQRERRMRFTAAEVDSIQFDSPMIDAGLEQARVTPSEPVKVPPKVVVTDNVKTQPRPAATPQPERTTAAEDRPPAASTSTDGPRVPAAAKPVTVSVKVLADETNNGWTNSGWVLKKGQSVRVTATGQISLGGGRTALPGGSYEIEDPEKLLKAVPTGALIAVIGDDNNDFVYIGSERTFTAERDGALFLGINEGDLGDNSGSFDVTIEIDPR